MVWLETKLPFVSASTTLTWFVAELFATALFFAISILVIVAELASALKESVTVRENEPTDSVTLTLSALVLVNSNFALPSFPVATVLLTNLALPVVTPLISTPTAALPCCLNSASTETFELPLAAAEAVNVLIVKTP